jgi:5'-deoxynucleotidase YfbR-like HD superfamily hydrolase
MVGKENQMISRDRINRSRYLAGCVKRYHTWPTIKTQTVGHHSWRVACIFVEVFGLPRAEVLYFCLHHDSGELFAGDIPFGIKKLVPDLKNAMNIAEGYGLEHLGLKLPKLTEEELTQVKISDLLEMYETGEYELNLGNAYAATIMQDTLHEILFIAKTSCMSDHVNDWLEERRSTV